MPTSAFPVAPAGLTAHLQGDWNALLPPDLHRDYSVGNMLNARLLSMPDRSTSELLRTR
jgi:hypothetical protein